MLEELFYTFKLLSSDPHGILDFEYCTEFNETFLACLRKAMTVREQNKQPCDFAVINLMLNFDCGINVYTSRSLKKVTIIVFDLSKTSDIPVNKIFDMLEISFGDYTASVTEGK